MQSKNGNSALRQDYTTSFGAGSTGALLGFVFLLPFLGFKRKLRFNKTFLSILMLVMVGQLMSCKKSLEKENADANHFFVRIKQVDLDGSVVYSKVVRVSIK